MTEICFVCREGTFSPYFRLSKNNLETVRCSKCRLVVVVNSPINPDNAAAFYSLEAFEGKRDLQNTDLYEGYYRNCFIGYDPSDLTILQFKQILSDIKRIIRPNNNLKLLDIGCATGVFLDLARTNGWRAKGIEISEDLSRYARDQFGLDVKSDLYEAAFPSAEFDAVTLLDVVEHLPPSSVNDMLKEISRIVKPGGFVVIRTPSEDAFLRALAKAIFFAGFHKLQEQMHLFYSFEHILNFTPESLTAIFKRYGLTLVHQRREEENPERLNISKTSKLVLRFMYLFSAVLKRQHKIVQIYRRI